jgi:hypothetical protein
MFPPFHIALTMNRKAKIQMDKVLLSGLLPFKHTADKSDPQNSTLWKEFQANYQI